LDEIASQAAFAGGLLLMGVANLSALASVGVSPERHTALVATATILVLLLGVQLGRLLMRYQLRRLRGLLDTVTGEVLTKPANE
jgi:ABC-type proline/glycine betaine transport system permease subunit